MRQTEVGDLVLHFYHNTWEGNRRPEFRLCAFSYVQSECRELAVEPPLAGEWAGRDGYYRVDLEGFIELSETLSVRQFLVRYADEIRTDRATAPRYYPFIVYRDSLRLAQGTYLSHCTPGLYRLLADALGQGVAAPEVSRSAGQQQEYVEGARRRRETHFFARNPALAREAKRQYGYKCTVCGFDFEETYGELGRGFIECHHLNPLSERRGTEADNQLTTLDQVVVLCSNCHRMVHRKRPALSVEALKQWLAGTTRHRD